MEAAAVTDVPVKFPLFVKVLHSFMLFFSNKEQLILLILLRVEHET